MYSNEIDMMAKSVVKEGFNEAIALEGLAPGRHNILATGVGSLQPQYDLGS